MSSANGSYKKEWDELHASPAPAPAAEPYAVMGIMVENNAGEAAVKGAVIAAVVCVGLQICFTITQAAISGSWVQEIIFLICLIGIPICGYSGAKSRTKNHVQFFMVAEFTQGIVFCVIAVHQFMDATSREKLCNTCRRQGIKDCVFTDWLGGKRTLDEATVKNCSENATSIGDGFSTFFACVTVIVAFYATAKAWILLNSSVFVMTEMECMQHEKSMIGTVDSIVVEAVASTEEEEQ